MVFFSSRMRAMCGSLSRDLPPSPTLVLLALVVKARYSFSLTYLHTYGIAECEKCTNGEGQRLRKKAEEKQRRPVSLVMWCMVGVETERGFW